MSTGAEQGREEGRLRVVLDSNAWVSGLLFGGPPDEVLHLAREGRFDLFISRSIEEEVLGVLEQPRLNLTSEELADAASDLKRIPRDRIVVRRRFPGSCPGDPNDEHILESAYAAEADYLVTGDAKHLLPLREFEGIKIVSPRAFLEALWRHNLACEED